MNDSPEAEGTNPFPGLRPFSTDEEDRFFGRERQVDAMVDKLEVTHFLAVVGTSGSGKSSLVNCGLRPALDRGLMAGAGSAWRVAQFRPGSDPIGAMARELATEGVLFCDRVTEGLTLTQLVEVNLRMSKRGLIDIVEQAALEDDVNVLVVVDQFEELFRYRQLAAVASDQRQGSDEATAFVNLLLEVRERMPERIFVVLTMRSDFLGDCTKFPGLAEVINTGQYLVPRMTRDERRAAIEGPIHVTGADISPVLLTQLVNDVGGDPDQLSILQHALNRTWAHWRQKGGEGPLELAHYDAIGRMRALNEHADEAFHELNDEQQELCEKIFKALTDKADDPRGVRRPTRLAALCALTGASADEIAAVIDVFREPSRSFLMPSAAESLKADSVIDISHESLMRIWERLDRWADDEAKSAGTYRRLADTAKRFPDGTLVGPELQANLAWRDQERPNETWAARYRDGFARAIAFLEKSQFERDAAIEEKKRRDERELRVVRTAAVVMGLLAVAAVGLGVAAWLSRAEAQHNLEQAELAKARSLAQAAGVHPEDNSRTILLALEGLPDRASRDPRVVNRPLVFDMQKLLLGAITSLREFAVLTGHTADIFAVALTADGSRIVTGSYDKSARVWEAATGKQLSKLDHPGSVLAVAVTPDGKRIATGSTDHTVRIWSTSGDLLFELPTGQQGPAKRQGNVLSVAITPDGTRVVFGMQDGSAGVLDIDNGNPLFELKKQDSSIFGVAVTPDGENIVTVSADHTIRISSARTGDELRSFTGHNEQVTGVVVTPDGSQIVTRSMDRSVRVWDFMTGQQGTLINNNNHIPLSIGVLPKTRQIVVGWNDATVRVYEAGSNDEISGKALLGHQADVQALAVAADGKRVITGSNDKTVRIWGFENANAPPSKFDNAERRQELVEWGKKVVPRCLTISERRKLALAPKPPDWCVDKEKYPYNTQAWKDWRAKGKALDPDVVSDYADFADEALKGGGDVDVALEAANLSVAFDESLKWTRVNLAHAHMFNGETQLAREQYMAHCQERLELGMLWKEAVIQDFREMRAYGRYFPLMDEIEVKFNSPACAEKTG
jgi:WD40 repeat protein